MNRTLNRACVLILPALALVLLAQPAEARRRDRNVAQGDPQAIASDAVTAVTDLADAQVAANTAAAQTCMVQVQQLLSGGNVPEAQQVAAACIRQLKKDSKATIRQIKDIRHTAEKQLKKMGARDLARQVKTTAKSQRRRTKKSGHDAAAAIRRLLPDDDS